MTLTDDCLRIASGLFGPDVTTATRRVDGWLEVTATTLRAAPADKWALLRVNANLPGSIRAAATREGAPIVRADAWIGSDSASEDAELSIDDVLRFALEAGWRVVDRKSVVEIAIQGTRANDAIRLAARDGQFVASVRLLDANDLGEASCQAVAAVLLQTSAVVRSVKGAAWTEGSTERAGLMAAASTPRAAGDVDRLLSALTAAVSVVAEEVRALSDDKLARDYLAWRARHTMPRFDRTEQESTDRTTVSLMEDDTCLQQQP